MASKSLTQGSSSYSHHVNDYNNGLLGCLGDIKSCLFVCCCSPCAAGELYEGMDMGSYICGATIFCFCSCLYPCIWSNTLRAKQSIDGSCCGDTCLFYCCPLCEMTRHLREIRGT